MLSSITVLVVDDDPLSLHYTRAALRSLGFGEAYSAQNGTEALEVVAQQTIGLVLANFQLPGMTGLELVMKLRAGRHSKDIPVILMTGRDCSTRADEALRMKPSAYVIRPFTIAKFRETVTRVLRECGHTV